MALAALPRSARLLRWAGSLEGPALMACRGFSSSSAQEDAAGPGPAASSDALADSGELLAAADGAAELLPGDGLADGLAAAAGAAAAGGGSEIGSILGATMAAVDGLHAATGLPWWATIASVGVLVRAAMFPVSLQGMKASASLMPLLRQAREEVSAAMRPPVPPPLQPPPAAQPDGKQQKQQKWQRSQQQAAGPDAAAAAPAEEEEQGRGGGTSSNAAGAQAAGPAPSNAAILARFTQLRRAAGAPHPIWVLASPLAQLPVFITAMATVRTMSITGWPGFSTGGAAWFPDLTMPALDVANMVAPMGTLGVVLPLGITVSMFANIDAAFSAPAGSKEQSSVMLWVTGSLRLFMEWMMVPIFAVALQIPHGALCYWATSSSLALLQNHALKQEAVRRLVGLPVGAPRPVTGAAPLRPAPSASAAAAAAVASGTAGGVAAGVDPELRQFLLTTSDQMALFEKAAALRAEGRAGATSTVLQRLLQLYPGQPNALYALGQVHAALKDWALSEQYYLQAAQSSELEQQMRARAWFGAAVAMHMQQEDETAIDAFKKAADVAQSDELRVRSWVSQATLHRKLGDSQAAVRLLRKAARAEPKVEEVYLKPLLAELAGQQQQQQQQQQRQPSQAADEEALVAEK